MGGGELMKWDRFFPRRRSMRVLLVENDDSTRHVVAALLRKCSYVVAAVADGVKAWEVLMEKQNKFDLILSEVDMPSLSGIDFLAKVMGCDLSKNIPVIMMSSQDSVNVVFKCMIQGAVDFLVKPVRKNELQNLWQHVWRKHCTSNCISPVEGIDDNQAISQDVSAKFVAIDHEDAESASKSKDNGGDVGDTQSSDSKSEFGTRYGGKYEELSDSCKASDKDMGTEPEANNIAQGFTMISENCPGSSESNRPSRRKKSVSFNEEIDGNSGRSKPFRSVVSTHPNQITDFIGAVTTGYDSVALGKDASNIEKDIASGLLPLQEISPGRHGLIGFSQQGFKDRRVLKPSAASAFSRYGKNICDTRQTPGPSPATLCTLPKKQTGIFLHQATADKEEVPSFCAWNSAPSAERETDKLRNKHIISSSSNDRGNTKACARGATFSANQSESPGGEHNGHHSSNEVNQNGMIIDPSQLELMPPFPFPVGRIPIQSLYAGYGAVLQPLLCSEASPSRPAAVQAAKEVILSVQPSCLENNHPSYDPSYQQNYVTYSLESDRMNVTVGREQGEPETSMHTESEQMDQRNYNNANNFAGGGIMSGDITDYHCSFVMSTHQADESRYQTINGNGSDHGRSLREAALMKFRLKRKDRCFEKKVRYHSRKMLAEQRPRIKGQFVRQTMVQPTMTTTGEDD